MSKDLSMTELRRQRKLQGITLKEVAERVGMSAALYAMHENGSRKYPPDKYEKFFFTVCHAIASIAKEKKEASLKEATYRNEGLTINSPELKELMQADLDDDEDLVFQPITENLMNEAKNMFSKGLNVIQIAVRLGVCEDELRVCLSSNTKKQANG